jgi:tetratricopeptide (TPR) repeat protein
VAALVGLGRLALVGRSPDDALILLDRALALSPGHPEALALQGIYWMGRREFRRAAELMERAKAADPDLTMVYYNLGRSYDELAQFPRAEANLREAIERNPEHFQARDRLCSLYARTRDFGAAFREALEIATRRQHPEDYLRLGTYAAALGDFQQAEEAFQKSIERNASRWEGHYNLAELYMSSRRMDQAREQYQAALDRNNGAYEPLNGMGLFALTVDGDCARAIGLLEQAIEAAPTRPEPRLNLALACAKKREFAKAQRLAFSVLAMVRPGDPLREQAERLLGTIGIESQQLQTLK